uniref:FBD domain-containing protein n=1 Tax=Steinernema glaseri TaxID=37863 RepID=A0A1I7Z733_9BILA
MDQPILAIEERKQRELRGQEPVLQLKLLFLAARSKFVLFGQLEELKKNRGARSRLEIILRNHASSTDELEDRVRLIAETRCYLEINANIVCSSSSFQNLKPVIWTSTKAHEFYLSLVLAPKLGKHMRQ